jgi:putative membrane protein
MHAVKQARRVVFARTDPLPRLTCRIDDPPPKVYLLSMDPARHPYQQVDREELIVRDLLAADRTVLANERTLLSYIRTAVALAAAGGGIIGLLDEGLLSDAFGGILIALGVFTLVWGFHRFRQIRKRLAAFH